MIFKKFFNITNPINYIIIFLSLMLFIDVGIAEEENFLVEKFKLNSTAFAKIRRQLHQNPELKYEEKNTAQFIANLLKSYGYEVRTGIGGTGVTALLDSGIPGKTVMLRADMDGLPIQEETNVEYQSKNKGVMHACGHDGHVATLLMVAKIFKEQPSLFKGKIKFVFQPGEEGGAGAKAMIADGVLENPKVDVVFGYHNWPIKKGTIGTRIGSLMAGQDSFEIHINGKGGHAAMPHTTVNPILICAQLSQALQELVSQKNPTELAILNISSFNAGTTYNVIPDKASIKGTLRTVSYETRNNLISKMKILTQGIASSRGVDGDLIIYENNYPPTINTPEEAELVLKTAKEIMSAGQAQMLEHPVMPAEDFSFYLQKIPGSFFFVGYGENKASLHSSKYDFDDDILPIAAYVLGKTAINYLNEH